METMKELAIDAVVILLGWLVITAGSVNATKGLSCGPKVSSVQKAP